MGPVVHFEILGNNAERLRAFYRTAFGWQIGDRAPGAGVDDYTLVQAEPGGIGGGIGTPPDGYDGHVTFYLGVSNIEEAFAAIERSGGTRMMGPERVPGGPLIGLFRDPEGHVIGLAQNTP